MPEFQSAHGRVHYARHGKTGPALVMLHGLSSSSRIWLPQIHALRRQYRVHALDLPGHGQSERWPRYAYEDLAALLGQWMDHCGIERAPLVAMSIGCTVALTFALRHPERASALVLQSAIGNHDSLWHVPGWRDRVALLSLPAVLKFWVRVFGFPATVRTFGVRARRDLPGIEDVQASMDVRALRPLLWGSLVPPFARRLHELTMPILVVRGADDPMWGVFARYIAARAPRAALVEVPGTRHLVSLEEPRTFNELTMEFLGRSLVESR